MAKGMTRKTARRTAKAGGYKLKTASRLSGSQKSRLVYTAPKLKPSLKVKTVKHKGRKLVPLHAFVEPKRTRKKKSTPSF